MTNSPNYLFPNFVTNTAGGSSAEVKCGKLILRVCIYYENGESGRWPRETYFVTERRTTAHLCILCTYVVIINTLVLCSNTSRMFIHKFQMWDNSTLVSGCSLSIKREQKFSSSLVFCARNHF